jgi:hypothetical protein
MYLNVFVPADDPLALGICHDLPLQRRGRMTCVLRRNTRSAMAHELAIITVFLFIIFIVKSGSVRLINYVKVK